MKSTFYKLFVFALFFVPLLSFGQSKGQWLNFNWERIKFGTRYFDKAAMQVPFTIDGVNDKFLLQFDLGATSSMLYGNSINYYLAQNAQLAASLDTVHKKYLIQGMMNGGFGALKTHIDGRPFTFNQTMAYFKSFGDTLNADSAKASHPKHIGTLGAPFFEGKVLIIDYPNHRFAIVDAINETAQSKFALADCRLDNGRIKIPFTIGGTVYWVMFDTGSSLFPVMTNKKYYEQFTGNSPVDSIGITSWGKIIETYGRKMDKPLALATLPCPKPRCT